LEARELLVVDESTLNILRSVLGEAVLEIDDGKT